MKDHYSYIPGARIEGNDLYTLRDKVRQLLQRSNDSFPGSQPVSFSKNHIQTLMDNEYFNPIPFFPGEMTPKSYYLCEKSDGIRVLLYITAEQNMSGKMSEKVYLVHSSI